MSSDLIVNPHTFFVKRELGRQLDGIAFRSPVAGKGLQTWSIERFDNEDVRFAERVLPLLAGEKTLESIKLNDSEKKKLEDVGILISKSAVSQLVLHHCRLSNLRSKPISLDKKKIGLNPCVAVSNSDQVPLSLRNRLPDFAGVIAEGKILWVGSPSTFIFHPYHLTGPSAAAVEEVCSGERKITSLSDDLISKLLAAQAFLPSGQGVTRMPRSICDFNSKRQSYLRIPHLIPEAQLPAMQRYYECMEREGWVDPSLEKVDLRVKKHNEPLAVFFHQQMGKLISYLTDGTWRPSFCYWTRYGPGAVLQRHTDREQCGLTVSAHIDYRPCPARAREWPLYLEVSSKARPRKLAVRTKLGEGVLFDGRSFPHYRPKLKAGTNSGHIFFCFVPKGFRGKLD